MSHWKILGTSLALTLPAANAVGQSGLPHMIYARGPATPQAVAGELLGRHNMERRARGVALLSWDPALAQSAQIYANELAHYNVMRHSPKSTRRGIGENLWMGTRNQFRPAMMVGHWASERSMYRPATFPAVSTTGNWADVGHYTQMIWPGTQRVGCAIGQSASFDILVCRYWPKGNIDGQRVP